MIYLKFDSVLQFKMEMDSYFTRDTEWDEDSQEHVEVGDKYLIGKWKSDTHGYKPRQWELWVRGTLSIPTGETTTDDDGNETPVMETLTGFHVDLDTKQGSHDLEDWAEKGYIQEPANPQFRK